MTEALVQLVEFIRTHNGIGDKARLARATADAMNLVRDRSVFYSPAFAIRFCSAASASFSNTVLSLSCLQKYDNRPFIVCVVTPTENFCLLSNSTFLSKVSHSSQALREDNIRGSFNGSDIAREFQGVANIPANIDRLFAIHAGIGFDGNLCRLVEATNNISPTGEKFEVGEDAAAVILAAPARAARFVAGAEFGVLKGELDTIVDRFRNEILVAALIDNVNLRGRVIEYLIAGEDDALRQEVARTLIAGDGTIPPIATRNAIGDYHRHFEDFLTETDIKTKIVVLNSNPKGYNLDKMLSFLTQEGSVFMYYFVGIDPAVELKTSLVSMFQRDLLRSTVVLHHWAGRNSRGVTQLDGAAINALIEQPDQAIDDADSVEFLSKIIGL